MYLVLADHFENAVVEKHTRSSGYMIPPHILAYKSCTGDAEIRLPAARPSIDLLPFLTRMNPCIARLIA
jgi:hypothetical protein